MSNKQQKLCGETFLTDKNENSSMSYSEELESISNAKGVGPSSLENFEKAGLTDPGEIGKMSAKEIEEKVEGVGYKTAVKILKELEKQGYRQKDIEQENREKLIALLEELFEFDKKDRDFGVYRLMNQKRDEVEKFLYNELLQTVEEELKEFKQVDEKELEKEREKIRKNLGSSAIKPNGDIKEDYKDAPIVKDYLELRKSDEKTPENIKAEIYNSVYKFFNRYYESGDFITRRYRSNREPKYCAPYEGGTGKKSHWGTKNQYYAKTSENFSRFSFNHKRYKYKFITENTETLVKEKVDGDYFVMQKTENITVDRENKEIIIVFGRHGLTEEELDRADISTETRKKQDKLLNQFHRELTKFLSSNNIEFSSEEIDSKLEEYTERNTSDFFIHKNLKKFLTEELKQYINGEVRAFDPMNEVPNDDLTQKKAFVINNICAEIISFLSNIEDFKKKVFTKKKFIKKSKNLVPVGEIDSKYYEKIINNENQIEEWAKLYDIDSENIDINLLDKEPYCRMMVNTNLYKEKLIKEQPKNKLIRGENYQALNLLQEKYKNSIKCIYIDPPYNTGNPNFPYKDDHKRPTWLSLMYDRLRLARELLTEDGIIFISIDKNENFNLRDLCNNIFEEENMLEELIWITGKGDNVSRFSNEHEYVLAFSSDKSKLEQFKGEEQEVNLRMTKNRKNSDRKLELKFPAGTRFEGEDEVFTGTLFKDKQEPIEIVSEEMRFEDGELAEDVVLKAEWTMHKRAQKWFNGNKNLTDNKGQPIIEFYFDEKGKPRCKKEKNTRNPSTVLDVDAGTKQGETILNNVVKGGADKLNYPKPPELIRYLCNLVVEDGDTVLDFFAGSGTTAQAVQEINREEDKEINYILVEMMRESYNIVKERTKKIAFSNNWENGKPKIDYDTSLDSFNREKIDLPGSVQCLSLESYEEALDAIEFEEEQSSLSDYKDYFINYLFNFETDSPSNLLDLDNLSIPKQYKLKLCSQEDINIDVMKTFNYLIGLEDIEVNNKMISGTEYTIYRGKMGGESTLIIWRHKKNVEFEKEREEIEYSEFSNVYINGDSCIPNARMIQPVFKNKMFEGDKNE